ncbi:MAG: hypothetical protein V7K50_28385 [Nostoc sp.]
MLLTLWEGKMHLGLRGRVGVQIPQPEKSASIPTPASISPH